MWAGAGFFIAGFWVLYALAGTHPALTSADPMMTLVRLVFPIALFSSYPIGLYWVLLTNAATYALVGLVTLERQFKHAS
jgi:hypothetical protein